MRIGAMRKSTQPGNIMRRFALFALMCATCIVPAAANVGRIKSVDDGVVIQRGIRTIEAKSGVVLEQGDIITTPAKAKVGITFIDNSRIALSGGSRLVIETFSFDDTTHDGQFVMQLIKGQIAVVSGLISKGGGKAMMIRTPKSLYALRGAKMVVKTK
jgi:hypothetical protein